MAALVLEDFLPYRLSVTSNRVSDTIARAYDALFGLSIPEWRLVAVIAEQDGVSQAAVGQRTAMDKVTVSRAAIALSARGLISRAPNPSDRRSPLLALTPAGRRLYAAVVPEARRLEALIFASFTAEERAGLDRLLRRIELAVASLAAGEGGGSTIADPPPEAEPRNG